ncbi:MAG TPA: ASKHA domain-containing protein [Desulfobacteria bacterium]|nr:ASKHA domain-containing protein [Desulfobacteria bacterium]
MDKVRVFFSNGKDILVDRGMKLSRAMEVVGIKKDFPCGGLGKCGQCETEISVLQQDGTKEVTSVLACSYKIEHDIFVQFAGEEIDKKPRILTAGCQNINQTDPGVIKVFINEETDLKSIKSRWGKVSRELVDLGITTEPSLGILQRYANLSRARIQKGFTAISVNGKMIGLEEGDTTGSGYGLAIDVGTTTVVVYLMDILSGKQIAVGADLNGQRVYGADVISRISTALNEEGNLNKLQKEVIGTINCITEEITSQAGIKLEEIYYVTIAGNTCMHHLLLGLDPSGLGRAPFLPVWEQELEIKASEIGLAANRDARVWVFPVIAGFVGGDTVAAILATELHRTAKRALLIDIGTNGEMVVTHHGKMIACSAAAGPALEGAQIECGMRAEKGAINKARLSPEVEFEVIGTGFAKGICGSGLIDLLADMIRANLVSERGKLARPEQYEGPEYLRSRLKFDSGGNRFIIAYSHENGGREIFLSQKDISQIQMAKGALRAALELLVKSVGIEHGEIEELLVAGAFGNFMDISNAITIGLLPHWAKKKIRLVGNAAGEGAKAALLSREKRAEAAIINKKVDFLELAGTAKFQEAFIKGMLFREEYKGSE